MSDGPGGPRSVTMLAPLPGLGTETAYTLEEVDAGSALWALRSDEGSRLYLVPAARYAPGYRPELPEGVRTALGQDEPEVLLVLHPGAGGEAPSVNLLAPVLLAGSRAAQVVLEADLPVRAPLG